MPRAEIARILLKLYPLEARLSVCAEILVELYHHGRQRPDMFGNLCQVIAPDAGIVVIGRCMLQVQAEPRAELLKSMQPHMLMKNSGDKRQVPQHSEIEPDDAHETPQYGFVTGRGIAVEFSQT